MRARHHLLLTSDPSRDDEGPIEVGLTEDGSQTRMVVEDRGLPKTQLPFHASGWRVPSTISVSRWKSFDVPLACVLTVQPRGEVVSYDYQRRLASWP